MIQPTPITEESVSRRDEPQVNPLAIWNTNKSEKAWGWKERYEALPLPMLYLRYEWLRVDSPYREPNPGFVKNLELLYPELSVHWIARYGRWGLFKKQRAFYQFQWNGSTITYHDYFPMLVSVIAVNNGEYIDLNSGLLRYIKNYNRMNVYQEIVRRNKAEDEFFEKNERLKEEKFNDYHNAAKNEVEKNLRWHTGRVPDFSVPVTREISKGVDNGKE
jgi:hypothetical protein